MEISRIQHTISSTGEEKYEMLELNRRLESYLNHVKLLEEENQLLWKEIQATQRNQDTGGKRKAHKEALSLARKELQNAWREKNCVELEVSNLLEEIKELNILRQKEKSAQAEAKKKLEESKRELENERRMQIWLKEQATYLEKEISLQVQVHEEDLAAVRSSSAISKHVLMAPQHSQTLDLQGLGEEFSQRAVQAWHEAAGTYQKQMKNLEESLDQTRDHMSQIKQEKKVSQLLVQDLAKELESAKAKQKLMEKNLVQQKQGHKQDLQHLQAHVEALEAAKLDHREQIGELLVESRNLLQMKMSLSLEVATYRALLDSEGLRVNNRSAEGITKSSGIPLGTQAFSSCLFNSPLNTTSRSIIHKSNHMTPILSSILKTSQETLKRPQTTKDAEFIVKAENLKLETSTNISKHHFTGVGFHDYYKAEVEARSTAFISEPEVAKAVSEPETIFDVKDLQKIIKTEVGPIWVSTNETVSPGYPQTPECVSAGQQIEEARSSEDGEEETEVSTEMAQISHAPVSAWENDETVIPEEQEVALELESEDSVKNDTQALRINAEDAEKQLLVEKTNQPASLLLEEIPQFFEDSFSPVEDDSEILTWADVKEDVMYFVEEESLTSAPEVERESANGTKEVEEKMDVEQPELPGIEDLENPELHEVQKEGNKTEQETKVEQSNVEEMTNAQEERMIEKNIGESFIKQDAKLMMNTYKKDDLVDKKAESVMEKDRLVNPEEEQEQSDDDESLNISASWLTDPGEADSYAQENTLADTRPLIHYRSDEETDGNIPVSHMGVSEPTDSEEERAKHEGGSHWSHISAKRFDTMEDLSEEPDLGSMNDIVTHESVETVLRKSIDEESVVKNESDDMDSHVKILMEDALEDQTEGDLRGNSNEDSQGEEETKIENYQMSTSPMEKQEESSQLHNWSPSLYKETREMNEQASISEDAITEADKVEDRNIKSIEINSEGESDDKMNLDTPVPEPFPKQGLAKEPCEEASTEITHSEVLLFETAITEDQTYLKEDDVQSNLSMLTHADITDEFSLHSHPESQTNTNDSDLEEPNSSEDESPNVSQHSQLLAQSNMQTGQLDQDSATAMDVALNADPFFTGVPIDEGSEDYNDPQAEESENREEQQYIVDSSSGGMAENTKNLPQEWENVGQEMTSTSHSILSTAEEGDVEMESKEDTTDILLGDALKEEGQISVKENDPHNFFSSSIKEGIWSATEFEMAATYDPNDQIETEKYSYDSINPNQTMTFGRDWGGVPPTNIEPEKDTGTCTARLIEKEEEELKMPQVKQVQCSDVKDGNEEAVHAEDSTDEGDSWSSGEE